MANARANGPIKIEIKFVRTSSDAEIQAIMEQGILAGLKARADKAKAKEAELDIEIARVQAQTAKVEAETARKNAENDAITAERAKIRADIAAMDAKTTEAGRFVVNALNGMVVPFDVLLNANPNPLEQHLDKLFVQINEYNDLRRKLNTIVSDALDLCNQAAPTAIANALTKKAEAADITKKLDTMKNQLKVAPFHPYTKELEAIEKYIKQPNIQPTATQDAKGWNTLVALYHSFKEEIERATARKLQAQKEIAQIDADIKALRSPSSDLAKLFITLNRLTTTNNAANTAATLAPRRATP